MFSETSVDFRRSVPGPQWSSVSQNFLTEASYKWAPCHGAGYTCRGITQPRATNPVSHDPNLWDNTFGDSLSRYLCSQRRKSKCVDFLFSHLDSWQFHCMLCCFVSESYCNPNFHPQWWVYSAIFHSPRYVARFPPLSLVVSGDLVHHFRWDVLHTQIFCQNQPTHSWSWTLLEKLPILQLLKSFLACYGTRRFVTVFTRALHWPLSWARSIQSVSSHPV
jgi:hypothetical protein